MNGRAIQLCCLWLCLTAGFSAADPSELQTAIQSVTEQPHFKHAHWGILVVDQDSSEVLYERNADKLFAPASTTKLFSVATALAELGADHRFKTQIVRKGEIKDGELDGDLILIASGDLSFGGRTNSAGEIEFTNSDHTYANDNTEGELTSADPLAGLNDLARQVVAAGIKRVRGDVLIDDRLFEKSESSGSGPTRVSPIMVNDNLVDFTIEPTQPGQPAKVAWRPETKLFQVENKVETGDENTKLETWIRDYGNGRIVVSGKIAAGHTPVVRVYEVPDAAAFARALLIEALGRTGVVVDAPLAESAHELPEREEVQHLPEVAAHMSPPLAQSARLILKVSHNLQASTLPLLVGGKHGKRTLSEGLQQQRDVLAKLGVSVDTISFGGGAGGSRADYVTPRAAIELLRHMAKRDDYQAYHDAMPILGVDGTLASVVNPTSPARGKVFAKTGTFYWTNGLHGRPLLTSKALAGYMTTASDRKLCFALFVNSVHLKDGVTAKSVGKDLGRICELIHGR